MTTISDWTPYFPEIHDTNWIARRLAESATSACRFSPAIPSPPSTPAPAAAEEIAFGSFIHRLVAASVAGPLALVAAHPALADPASVIAAAQAEMIGTGATQAIRTLVTLLHEKDAAGLLAGDTPEERYSSFCDWLETDAGCAELLRRYPVLVGLVQRTAEQRARYLVHVLDRCAEEWDRVVAALPAVDADDRITHIDLGSGDTHAGGRSVCLLSLTSGARVVYKPRDLSVDLAFQRLVRTVCSDIGIALPTISLHTTTEDGWAEFVEAPQGPIDEVAYTRGMGRLLALVHLVNGHDIHFENVLAHSSGQPVIIDLESLLRPDLVLGRTYADGSAAQKATRRIDTSVLGIGLLPTTIAGAGDATFDIGATGYSVGQLSPYKAYVLENRGRSDLRIAFDRVVVDQEVPGPRITLEARAARDAMTAGFRDVMDWAVGHRERLVALLEEYFGGTRVRYIHNPTMFYAQLLRIATHPSFLADPIARRMILQRCGLRLQGTPDTLTRSEVRQLDRGEVPIFLAYAAGNTLLDDQGEPLDAPLVRTPLESAQRRIATLTPAEVEEQARFIALAFVPKLSRDRDETPYRWGSAEPQCGDLTDDMMRAEVNRLADILVSTVILADHGCPQPPTWVAPSVTTDEAHSFAPAPLGYDLYGGIPGLALFLAAAHRATGHAEAGEVAQAVVSRLTEQLDPQVFRPDGIGLGAGTGISGALWAAARSAELLGDDEVRRHAVADLAALAPFAAEDRAIDLVGGAAGFLAVTLDLHDRRRPCDADLRPAQEAARKRLVRWWDEGPGEVYSGFAHGIAGMIPYLLREGSDDATRVATEMATVLAGLRDPRTGDWSRSTLSAARSTGWCHGAPGIALSLSLTWGYRPDLVSLDHLDAALDRTTSHGFGNNVTLCHGDLGNLEILAEVARRTGRPGLGRAAQEELHRLFGAVLQGYELNHDNRLARSTSAYVGSSAIGLTLCRHLIDSVPSLLSLS